MSRKSYGDFFPGGLMEYNTLYRVHLSIITKLSPIIAQILAIPNGKEAGDPTQEGAERFPLHFAGLTVHEFEDFLFWMYKSEWKPITDVEIKERVFIDLLKLSSMWEMEVGKQYAVAHLQNMDLAPSRRLQLARQFSIPEWVSGAVEKIFQGKLSDLNDLDIACIDVKSYSIIAKGMAQMDIEMRRTANVEPPMTTDANWECKKHSTCIAT
ncbi:hypothetical protein B0H13DRAFT_2315995 [Mycena leptocephala]|nr:hypothetical protein B0H13DRAFT_2315995 [Mycena leptocephala]